MSSVHFVAPARLAPILLALLVVATSLSSDRTATRSAPSLDPLPRGVIDVAPEGLTVARPVPVRTRIGPWIGPAGDMAASASLPALGPTPARLRAASRSGPAPSRPRPTTPRFSAPPWTEPAWSRAWVRVAPTTTTTTPPTTPAPTAPPTTAGAPAGTNHVVRSPNDWRAAVVAARPGDVIRLAATINHPLQYRGPRAGGNEAGAADGAPGRPITITADDGVWIDPGNPNNVLGGLDVIGADHIHVIGVRVRNSQFGIRLLQSSGTAEHPNRVTNNQVVDIGHAGIHVAGDLSDHTPSRHVRVEGNVISATGRTGAPYGEGIYIGYGTREWVDRTSNVVVAGNRISATTAEGIDIKPGTRNVAVVGNMIHDLSPINGGAISAHYVGTTPNPDPRTAGNIVIRRNRIWNLNLDNRGGSNDWAIWIGHGGVTVEANAIWSLRNDAGAARAVRIRGLHDFGPHPIRIVDNVFWTASGWMAEGSPSGAALVQAGRNRGPAGAAGIDTPMAQGPGVPPLGAAGTADNGGGPGSALGFG